MRYKCLEFIFLVVSITIIDCQCNFEPILGTKIGNIKIETDDFELANIMGSILQLLVIIKKETFYNEGEFIRTQDSSLCQFVGEGVDLQQLASFNSTYTNPVLTSARIVGEKILIQGRKRSTLVNSSLLATLLNAINIENHVNLEKSAALVFIQVDGRRILTNFEKKGTIFVGSKKMSWDFKKQLLGS